MADGTRRERGQLAIGLETGRWTLVGGDETLDEIVLHVVTDAGTWEVHLPITVEADGTLDVGEHLPWAERLA